MRESGLSAGACNVYIRSINSFLSWLHENGYVTEPLRLRQLPQEKKIIPALVIFSRTLEGFIDNGEIGLAKGCIAFMALSSSALLLRPRFCIKYDFRFV